MMLSCLRFPFTLEGCWQVAYKSGGLFLCLWGSAGKISGKKEPGFRRVVVGDLVVLAYWCVFGFPFASLAASCRSSTVMGSTVST